MALSRPARAADPAPGPGWLGAQFGISGGAGFATPQGAVNAELARAGWPALPSASPTFQLRFGLMAYEVSLDMHFAGSDEDFPRSPGSAEDMQYHRKALGVDFGYRMWLVRALSLSPYVGIGSVSSVLCFEGHPDSTSWTSRPPFEQILRNPGRLTCLEASAVGLDVGLSLAWNLRLAFEQAGSMIMGSYLSIGPRAAYTLSLSSGRTWEKAPSSDLGVDLPPFEGPVAPLNGAYAGIEIQLRFAVEGRP
jgi:hypothetical protein